MSRDRITYNGEDLDEVVITGSVHIEALDVHTSMIWIGAGDGRWIHMEGENLRILESEGVNDLVTVGPPLLGCGERWEQGQLNHRCVEDETHAGLHECDCGSTTKENP